MIRIVVGFRQQDKSSLILNLASPLGLFGYAMEIVFSLLFSKKDPSDPRMKKMAGRGAMVASKSATISVPIRMLVM